MSGQHARFGPSGAHRWMRCPASIAAEAGSPDTTSPHAAEGTAAHFVASECLTADLTAAYYLGRVIAVGARGARWAAPQGVLDAGDYIFVVDDDMALHVQTYLDAVHDYAAGQQLLVEQRVHFGDHIGVADQFGTADAVVLTPAGRELQVHDLKYGRGITVDAEENAQLMLYALGALDSFSVYGDYRSFRLVIHQPRLDHVSEWACSLEDLVSFAEEARVAAEGALDVLSDRDKPGWETEHADKFVPGDKQCRWCKAKATCPALGAVVLDVVASVEGFDDLSAPRPVSGISIEDLAEHVLPKISLIEDWCKAIRERAHVLAAEGALPGHKLVSGRRGARRWANEADAEAVLRGMRLKRDQMFAHKLVSPTQAEKLLSDSPRRWARLEKLITRSEGAPSLVPASDPRPAIGVASDTDAFEVLHDPDD